MTVVNVTPPVITGTPRRGSTLTSSQGTWTHDPGTILSYAYQWLRCDAAGANCVDIGGANSTSYLLGVADVGSTIRSEVTATESAAPPAGTLTGTHWPDTDEFDTLASIGYDFAVVTFQPGDNAAAAAKLDAADAAGIQLIIGMYPEPYSYSGGNWTVTSAGQSSLNYLESRESSIIALFVFNEPYNVGGYTAAQLRSLRTKIQTYWPTAKIYHDLGQPSCWVTGGFCPGGPAWDDQSNVADYAGCWYYPFKNSSVGTYPMWKSYGLSVLADEADFCANNIGCPMVWLGQSHSAPGDSLVYPSNANIDDWNDAVRAALPADALLSWYVWRQGLYPDYLVNHPTQWPLTVA